MSIKVLIAEDDPNLRHDWARAFQRAGGFEVSVAEHGQEALAAICEDLPDVLVTDYQMPVFSGFEVARSLRVMPGGADTRVIMVTSEHNIQYHEEADLVDMFLLKPVSYDDLVQFAKRLRGLAA